MNRSEYRNFACMFPDGVMFGASVVGANAAAPTIPTTVNSLTSSLFPMTAANNYAALTTSATPPTRVSSGVYTVTLKDSIPVIIDILPSIWGLDGKQASMTDYNPTTRVITFKTFTAAGAVVDIATTDVVKFVIFGQLTVLP